MTKKQIRAVLENSERWGCNNQPALNEAIEIFCKLPVRVLDVSYEDTVIATFTRPLNQQECFFFFGLHFDEPAECTKDQTYFKLWWD